MKNIKVLSNIKLKSADPLPQLLQASSVTGLQNFPTNPHMIVLFGPSKMNVAPSFNTSSNSPIGMGPIVRSNTLLKTGLGN